MALEIHLLHLAKRRVFPSSLFRKNEKSRMLTVHTRKLPSLTTWPFFKTLTVLCPCTVDEHKPVAYDLVQLICEMDFCRPVQFVTFLAPLVLAPKSKTTISPHRPSSLPFLKTKKNVILRCKMLWPSETLFPLFPRKVTKKENGCRGWARSHLYQRSVYLSSLAMHVHLYYGFWRLSVGLKKKKRHT